MNVQTYDFTQSLDGLNINIEKSSALSTSPLQFLAGEKLPLGGSLLIPAQARAKEQRTQRASILLVEDNPADVRLVEEAVRHLDVNLTIAVNGEDALDFLVHEPRKPDLVILDLNLPKIDGFAVLEQYRLRPAPVVIFSSTQNAAEAQRALSLGASEFVLKPGTFSEFIGAVVQIVARFLPDAAPGQ